MHLCSSCSSGYACSCHRHGKIWLLLFLHDLWSHIRCRHATTLSLWRLYKNNRRAVCGISRAWSINITRLTHVANMSKSTNGNRCVLKDVLEYDQSLEQWIFGMGWSLATVFGRVVIRKWLYFARMSERLHVVSSNTIMCLRVQLR